MDHIRTVLCITYRIFRNIGFYITKLQVIACIQHTAVSISTSLAEIILCFLSCCDKHLRSLKMLCKKGLRNLRSEVSKIYTECVTACFFDILQSLDHMDLTLYDTDRTFVDILCIVFLCVSVYKSFSPVYGKAFRKTISADCNDSDLNFWHVVHNLHSPFYIRQIFHR